MIVLENLKKTYGAFQALRGVSLEIYPDEILGLVGPSGSGKTSLLRLVAGLETPDEGRILIDGSEASTPAKIVAPHERNLSMIFQDLALWPHMKALAHVEFVLRNRGAPRSKVRSQAEEYLNRVNLNGHSTRYPHQLSGGEKQRLAIARALSSQPGYLLMDEPLSNLDPILKEEMLDLIKEIKAKQRMGVVYVTHDVREAVKICDRIAVINEGLIEQVGATGLVMEQPKNGLVARMLKL